MKLSVRSRRLTFTKEGKIYTALCLAIGIAAINTGSNILFLLLSAMLSLIITSGVLSENSLRKIRVRRLDSPKVFCNKPFLYGFKVENQKKIFPAFCLSLTDEKMMETSEFILYLKPFSKEDVFVKSCFKRRGIHQVDKICIETKYPFGFFKKTKIISVPSQVIVFPAIKDIPQIALSSLEYRRAKLLSASLSRNNEENFFGLKEYRIGDNPKLIYWKSLAKYKDPMLKEYEEMKEGTVDLILDLTPSSKYEFTDSEKEMIFESALCLCASLIYFFSKRKSLFNFKIIFGTAVIFNNNSNCGAMTDMLEKLASLDFKDFKSRNQKVDNAESSQLFLNSKDSLVIILSDERKGFYKSKHIDGRHRKFFFSMEDKELLKKYYPYEN
ncbi:MAG: DUF58 domain-containing protein [Candidatus Schekmanbacteria bacterium]|nr:MAG: DUF58 domain-containing protein [Candidatus Schekmanbacteria bacterium]